MWKEWNKNMEQLLEKCEICPHKCKINRTEGKFGACKAPNNPKIAFEKFWSKL